jgi:hypothetical protein
MNKTWMMAGLLALASQPLLAGDLVWQRVAETTPAVPGVRQIIPQQTSLVRIDENQLKDYLHLAPETATGKYLLVELPAPDGSRRMFRITHTPVMPEGLGKKYPSIQTYSGWEVNHPSTTIKLDYNNFGFHAMVLDNNGHYFIDPYSNEKTGVYQVYYKSDFTKSISGLMHCEEGGDLAGQTDKAGKIEMSLPGMEVAPVAGLQTGGDIKRTYRLALACSGEYAAASTGINMALLTKSDVLSKMVTSVNRVNGVYEKELAVTLELINTTDTLIFLNSATDPYNNASSDLNANQTVCDSLIGTANYDIGHVFTTGSGGIAQLGCVCLSWGKARGTTGSPNPVGDPFDIDYVAHEMGHQFGGSHTFNANTGSCQGNGSANSAYEPGSGTTIMAYAGICGALNNVQSNSDAYFHIRSLDQISSFLNGTGNTCALQTPTNNTAPQASAGGEYSIPTQTFFELEGGGTDPENDPVTFAWEEYDRGNFGDWNTPSGNAPLFRTYMPDTTAFRMFPRLNLVLLNNKTTKGELLPTYARDLTFRLVARSVNNGLGSFDFTGGEVSITVVNTGSPFTITSPSQSETWTGNDQKTITWDVAGTNAAPINTSLVDIYFSADGGKTYPYLLKSGVPNDGSETIEVPNIATATGRVKVKGNGNVFFDINNQSLTVVKSTIAAGVTDLSAGEDWNLYPNPGNGSFTLSWGKKLPAQLNLQVVNALGQVVLSQQATNQGVASSQLPAGVYHVILSDAAGAARMMKKYVVQ